MLFFQISPGGEAAEPFKGRSQEGRPGTSRPPRPELSRPPSKGKQPAVSDLRRKMDWKLVVRPGDNIPPTGHKMETDAREYLEAKRAAAQQRSASGSTPYMKDPSLRLPSRTVGRSHGPSAFQPRQEKAVLQSMAYRRQTLANTSSNPVLKEYRREHIPIEGQIGSLYGDQQAARECYLTTLKPSSWKEKEDRLKGREDDSAEKVKGHIFELKQEVEKVQVLPLPESKPSMLLLSKKRKWLAIKEEKNSSEEVMAIMSLGLERPEPVESQALALILYWEFSYWATEAFVDLLQPRSLEVHQVFYVEGGIEADWHFVDRKFPRDFSYAEVEYEATYPDEVREHVENLNLATVNNDDISWCREGGCDAVEVLHRVNNGTSDNCHKNNDDLDETD
ncbi:hypothetical protein BVRB_2g037480 [Beta vulgaris subsp. vulgaris]|nr:hypothetical protein BVRB_2g037480 [Beta vulgaris subsp. vulgaris]